MEQTSITARISAFARAYHSENNTVKIFDDSVARQLLTDVEYEQISRNMTDGIAFFNPSFAGSGADALRWVVDHQLSPSPLGRAAFAERALENAVCIGAAQYLILGAGYDTFALRQPRWADKLQIFELDHPATANDKRLRLERAGLAFPANVHTVEADFTSAHWLTALTQASAFDSSRISFCSALGLTYYLAAHTFDALLCALSSVLPRGSALVFDYPDESTGTEQSGERTRKQSMLAKAANEQMLAGYSCRDIEQLLAAHGFLVYEHLTPPEITSQYFSVYNQANFAHPMTAFDHVNYCLAVKQ